MKRFPIRLMFACLLVGGLLVVGATRASASQAGRAVIVAAESANTHHHHDLWIGLLVFIFGLVVITAIFVATRVAQTRGRDRTSNQPPADPSRNPEQSD